MRPQRGEIPPLQDEYCFFFRNCNHFALDLAERLADGGVPAERLRPTRS